MNERDILAQKDFAVKEALLKGEAKGHAEGLAEGEARGRTEGREEGKREMAKNMLVKGFDKNTICEITGLSQEEIQSL